MVDALGAPRPLIDGVLWDRAEWVGMDFLDPRGVPVRPGLGLVFRDADATVEAFGELRRRLGGRDVEHELRIAILEGPIAGEREGYTVTVGASPVRSSWSPRGTGSSVPSGRAFQSLTRTLRVYGPDGLARFKRAYSQSHLFDLVPVVQRAPGDVNALFELAIEKRQLALRHTTEIGDTG